ncbi:MAG: hypothetical protein FJZ04_03515 [Candidatus Moranbacteria bacterium]|nr:hypothetical protein [Candidatus Moranbacteria bacterium]
MKTAARVVGEAAVTKTLVLRRAKKLALKQNLLGIEKLNVGDHTAPLERNIEVWVEGIANHFKGTFHWAARERNFRFPELEKKWFPLAAMVENSLFTVIKALHDLSHVGLDSWGSLPDG